jgi:hypothetical protein
MVARAAGSEEGGIPLRGACTAGTLRWRGARASWWTARADSRPRVPALLPPMPRLPRALTLVAAVIMILSSGAHSLLGWPGLRTQLAAANAPAALVDGLAMGWHFGGLMMLVIGVVVLWLVRVARDGATNVWLPLFVIGIAYELFAIGCAVLLGFDPFLFVFLIPGSLLSCAAALMTARRRAMVAA